MYSFNLVVLSLIVKFGRDDSAEVRCSFFQKSDRDLHLLKLLMEARVLHLFQDYALLHLSDVFLLNNSHKMLEGGIDFVRVELITFSNAFAQEVVPPFFRKS